MGITRRQALGTTLAAAIAGGARAADGKTLVIGMAADPAGGFDPEAVENNTCGFIMATVYDSLVRYKPGTVEVGVSRTQPHGRIGLGCGAV